MIDFEVSGLTSRTFRSLYAGVSEQGEGAGARSGQRCPRGPGGGGAAPPWAGAEGGGASGTVPPHPESSLEPRSDESVANTLPLGAHADAHCRRTAGGERLGVFTHDGGYDGIRKILDT